PSPSASQRRHIRRKCRSVTPNRFAPSAAASLPSVTCLNTDSRSRSRKLNVSTSSLRAQVRAYVTRTHPEGGHSYFVVRGHFYFNATLFETKSLTSGDGGIMMLPQALEMTVQGFECQLGRRDAVVRVLGGVRSGRAGREVAGLDCSLRRKTEAS